MGKKSYIKIAEENLLGVCKEFDELNNVLDGIQYFGNSYLNDYERRKFSEAFFEVRRIVDTAFRRNISRLFMLSGVGGDKAKKYAQKKLRELFREEPIRYSVMQFLDKYGNYSGSYLVEDEENFRKEVKEKLDKVEKNE